jgi:hypothetical protein
VTQSEWSHLTAAGLDDKDIEQVKSRPWFLSSLNHCRSDVEIDDCDSS